METRKSIDECSGEEWNSAAKSHWDFLRKADKIYEEDPVYSKQDEIFSGSIFDKACDAWLDDDEDEISNQEETYHMIEAEERFEQVVQILGPYYAISYCHGAALDILMNADNAHKSKKIEEAKVHLNRMARLINETEGVNW
jgi:hypothetical protein